MKTIEAYRLFRIGSDGSPMVLFHGFDHGGRRTRKVPFDVLLRAEERHVWNPGARTGPGFTSGWHVLLDRDACLEYRRRFVSGVVVCRVMVADLRPKPRGRCDVQLARYMMLSREDWMRALTPALRSRMLAA
ncbi:MAG: hypothetical protein WDA27_15125 [Actinomycetota bacterium]